MKTRPKYKVGDWVFHYSSIYKPDRRKLLKVWKVEHTSNVRKEYSKNEYYDTYWDIDGYHYTLIETHKDSPYYNQGIQFTGSDEKDLKYVDKEMYNILYKEIKNEDTTR